MALHARSQPILRPYGGWYSGYGSYLTDDEASRWIGFSSITLPILLKLDDTQQRALEDAQIKASEAPVGERVDWHERGAVGTAQTLREFKCAEGNYCREFEQTVAVDGRPSALTALPARTRKAYGGCWHPSNERFACTVSCAVAIRWESSPIHHP